MSKRNNVIENFEACYLHENCARRAFANEEAIKRLTSSPDFERCVKYIANISFNRNKVALLRHGFDHEDMINVARILAMQFINNEFKGETKKDTYNVLMRFISQKMETFMLFFNRKFRINERYSDVGIDDVTDIEAYMGTPEVNDQCDDDSKVMHKIALLRAEVNKFKTQVMRLRLSSDIGAHADRLAEIATSKSVEYAVRRKARRVCKQNGIDYIGWAKVHIKERNLNESDLALE
jgi:hypothetical protein